MTPSPDEMTATTDQQQFLFSFESPTFYAASVYHVTVFTARTWFTSFRPSALELALVRPGYESLKGENLNLVSVR